jgi:hypothetical protein
VNVQLATPRLTSERVQGEEPKVPDGAVPVTAPVGVTVVPEDSVSVTVAVQVVDASCCRVPGVHDTVVEVGWAATTNVVVPELVAWPSAGTYTPVIE